MNRKDVFIEDSDTLFDALTKMDQINRKLLIVTKDNLFLSLISIGDIQRAMLNSYSLETRVSEVLREDVFVGEESDEKTKLIEKLLDERVEFIPIVSINKSIVEILFWDDHTNEHIFKTNALVNVPVVIMAGGIGSRLKPLTNIIPKPLVPLGEKPIIQVIIERFMNFGCVNFFISVSYKGDMIKNYLDDLGLPCEIDFFEEDKPLGTAGSLSLIKDKLEGDFFVSNCDILIDQDYLEVVKYHRESNNSLTAIAAIKEMTIPYGIFETEENGQLTTMIEKPSYKFQVNAGIYVLNSECISSIPHNEFYNITTLMEDLKKKQSNVGVFPVSEGSWMDIGEWKEYNKTQEIFKTRFE